MRTASEDAEVTRLLGEYDRIKQRLTELGVNVVLRDKMNESLRDDPVWCPVCKIEHPTPVGEQTDAGVYTRACPKVSTDSPRYYGSPIYTGDRP